MNNLPEIKERATAALQALQDKIGGKPFYAWAGYWHPGGWTELVWEEDKWAEICTVPRRAKPKRVLRLSVALEGGTTICVNETIWQEA